MTDNQDRQGVPIARVVLWAVALGALIISALTYYRLQPPEPGPTNVVLITADDDAYWNRVVDGAQAAAAAKNMTLTVFRSDGTAETQSEQINSAVAQGFSGIVISPVDPNKQGLTLRRASRAVDLITVDSDSELSGRLCFVGADNYGAGRDCGELVKQALPDGGRVIIVMGPINKANGERRRQGLIDELLDRSYQSARPTDELDAVYEGANFTIAATLIDEIDPAAATANVRAALEADPEIDCVVGLFAYSTPAALEAVEALGRLDDVTLVGFDDREETLDAIEAGKVFGTIAQDQYSYGFVSVRLLGDIAEEGSAVSIPLNERIHIPPYTVTAETIGTFRNSQARTPAGG